MFAVKASAGGSGDRASAKRRRVSHASAEPWLDMKLVGPGVPYAVQRILKGMSSSHRHLQKLTPKQQAVYQDAGQRLRDEVMAEDVVLHILRAVKVDELTWHDIEFALCEFRKLLVGGPGLKEYVPRTERGAGSERGGVEDLDLRP